MKDICYFSVRYSSTVNAISENRSGSIAKGPRPRALVTAIDQTRITNFDDLSTYLEEHTVPQQTINVTIVRNSQTITVAVTLALRPT